MIVYGADNVLNVIRREIMQFSTTPTLEGQSIVEYCGVVTGEAILGANIFQALTKKSYAKRVKLLSQSWANRRKRWALTP